MWIDETGHWTERKKEQHMDRHHLYKAVIVQVSDDAVSPEKMAVSRLRRASWQMNVRSLAALTQRAKS